MRARWPQPFPAAGSALDRRRSEALPPKVSEPLKGSGVLSLRSVRTGPPRGLAVRWWGRAKNRAPKPSPASSPAARLGGTALPRSLAGGAGLPVQTPAAPSEPVVEAGTNTV